MKKIDIGQTIGILANLGVVAGIIFLAIEVGQNNELMSAAVRNSQNQRILEYVEQVYMAPGLAEVIAKANRGESLTDAESLVLFNRQLRLVRGFEVQFKEYVAGNAAALPLNWKEHFLKGLYRNPPLIGIWEEVRPILSPEFVKYVDDNVLTPETR
jgi:hypothetical protein